MSLLTCFVLAGGIGSGLRCDSHLPQHQVRNIELLVTVEYNIESGHATTQYQVKTISFGDCLNRIAHLLKDRLHEFSLLLLNSNLCVFLQLLKVRLQLLKFPFSVCSDSWQHVVDISLDRKTVV